MYEMPSMLSTKLTLEDIMRMSPDTIKKLTDREKKRIVRLVQIAKNSNMVFKLSLHLIKHEIKNLKNENREHEKEEILDLLFEKMTISRLSSLKREKESFLLEVSLKIKEQEIMDLKDKILDLLFDEMKRSRISSTR